jgi:Mor family transcriptional regulator
MFNHTIARDRRWRETENHMEQERAPAPKKLTVFARAARIKRIFARLNEGLGYDEIAREERLTARRVRQIVTEVLDRREVDGDSAHALLQLGRLGPALRAAGEAVAEGDVRAIAPLVKVLDWLDRYQKTARTIRADVKRKRLPASDEVVMAELKRRMRESVVQELAAEGAAQQAAAAEQ